MTMAQAIRFHHTGGPEVLQLEDVAVGVPAAPGQVRYEACRSRRQFRRTPTCAAASIQWLFLPGWGVEASGIVEAVGKAT